jgi:1-acyl-sn-glycerol-3-phosphate acyltransferase
LRAKTRTAAAADYWGTGALKRTIALRALNAVLIDRKRADPGADPLRPLYDVLEAGQSIIIFPEGTRGLERLPAPFKSGLYHLAQRFADVELIPVYLDNLNRSMPKGTMFPVPLICTVRFGAPLPRVAEEDKSAFLERARNAVIELAR